MNVCGFCAWLTPNVSTSAPEELPTVHKGSTFHKFSEWTVAEEVRVPNSRSFWNRSPLLVTADVGPYQTVLDLFLAMVNLFGPFL